MLRVAIAAETIVTGNFTAGTIVTENSLLGQLTLETHFQDS